jgi:hypothetical protein
MSLTRNQILAARARTHPVEVPEWGGQILLKPLSVAALGRFLESRDTLSAYQLYPLLLVLSACDDDGQALFDQPDAEALAHSSFDVLKRIGDEILKLNKIQSDDAPAPAPTATSPGDAPAKNSSTIPSGSGSLGLLSGSA